MPIDNKKINSTLTILLYHGVTDVASEGIENYSSKHIKRSEFISQMSFIKDNCSVLTMDEVVLHHVHKKPFSRNAVAVTFDDGFKNNFSVAMPILNDFNIPATFYICSGIIGTNRMFWVDALEDCINRCKKDRIIIKLDKKTETFILKGNNYRIGALERIKNFCKRVRNSEKNRIVTAVSKITGIEPTIKFSKNYQKMDWDDVKYLSQNKLFTIGSHSLRHDVLSKLSKKIIKKEILDSITEIEKRLNYEVRHYSYPEGQAGDYNHEIINWLKECGIVCCPSARDGVNNLGTDLFHLKRIMVGFHNRQFPFV